MIQKEYADGSVIILKKDGEEFYSLVKFDKYNHGTGMTLKYKDLLALKDFIQNIDFNTL